MAAFRTYPLPNIDPVGYLKVTHPLVNISSMDDRGTPVVTRKTATSYVSSEALRPLFCGADARRQWTG